jgi:hypothetical protein
MERTLSSRAPPRDHQLHRPIERGGVQRLGQSHARSVSVCMVTMTAARGWLSGSRSGMEERRSQEESCAPWAQSRS